MDYGLETDEEVVGDDTVSEVETDTVSLPASMLHGKEAKVGDIIEVRVKEVGDDGGVVVECCSDEKDPEMGVESLASEFD